MFQDGQLTNAIQRRNNAAAVVYPEDSFFSTFRRVTEHDVIMHDLISHNCIISRIGVNRENAVTLNRNILLLKLDP